VTEIAGPDPLALVRFGPRAPDEPRIIDSVKVVDAVLEVEMPRGPARCRYSGDLQPGGLSLHAGREMVRQIPKIWARRDAKMRKKHISALVHRLASSAGVLLLM
jgi:hypothetical protein